MRDLLERWPDVRFNIDCKADSAVDALAELIEATGAIDRVCIGAFSHRRLQRLRRRLGSRLLTALSPQEVASLRIAGRLPGSATRAAQVPTSAGRSGHRDVGPRPTARDRDAVVRAPRPSAGRTGPRVDDQRRGRDAPPPRSRRRRDHDRPARVAPQRVRITRASGATDKRRLTRIATPPATIVRPLTTASAEPQPVPISDDSGTVRMASAHDADRRADHDRHDRSRAPGQPDREHHRDHHQQRGERPPTNRRLDRAVRREPESVDQIDELEAVPGVRTGAHPRSEHRHDEGDPADGHEANAPAPNARTVEVHAQETSGRTSSAKRAICSSAFL